jgi:outer membrane lipoprotein LolB
VNITRSLPPLPVLPGEALTRRGTAGLAATLSLVGLLALAGCAGGPARVPGASSVPSVAAASTPVAEATSLIPARTSWDGRLSLKLQAFGTDGARGMTLGFSLQGSADQGELNLSTALGTQMAAVRWQRGTALLVTSDGTQRFASLDELTQHLLGESLPVTALMSWLQGRPDPLQPFSPAADADHQARVFEQAGWRVDLSRRSTGQVEASRDAGTGQRGATLKVRLDP